MADEQMLARWGEARIAICRLHDTGDAPRIQAIHDTPVRNQGYIAQHVDFQANRLGLLLPVYIFFASIPALLLVGNI
jgi:hypothetical protein